MHLDDTLINEDPPRAIARIDLDGDITLIDPPIDHEPIRKTTASGEKEILKKSRPKAHISQPFPTFSFSYVDFPQKLANGKGERNTHSVVIFKILLRPIQETHSPRILLGLGRKDGVVEGGIDVVGFQVQVGEVGQGGVEGAGEKLE